MAQQSNAQFRFEAGSYGALGSFMPSIACHKQITINKWEYHFVLVNPQNIHRKEEPAVLLAEKDLQSAFEQKQQSGSDTAIGQFLKDKGYISVSDFKIVGT